MLGFSPLAAAPLADDGAIGVVYQITAATGSFALTGQASTLTSVRSVDVTHNSFTLTGQDTTLNINSVLSVDAGTFTLTGIDADPRKIQLLVADTGTFALTGQEVNAGIGEAVESNSYSLTGQDVNLTKSVVENIVSGSFALTGQNSNLSINRVLVAEANTEDKTFTITVANDGGGNVFYIDGVNHPVLTLERNRTYIFDQSNASNSNHPLRFKDGSGNSYTAGVSSSGTAGTSGATVTIAVASDAPDDLRYYCTVHGNGMGNTIGVVDGFRFSLTGQSATLEYLPGIIPATATFSVNTQDAVFNTSSPVSGGSFTLTGQSVSINTTVPVTLNSLTSSVGTITIVENVNNYNAEDFNSSRVTYLRPLENKDTVYVTEQTNIVYILPKVENNFVHILPESRTVYVVPQEDRQIIYIAA